MELVNTLENIEIMYHTEKEITYGQMETNTLEDGKKVVSTDKEL